MKNYLALDLGVGSIGVALYQGDIKENIKEENLHTFVRIFDTANENITRRSNRLIRRTLDKRQKRKIALWKELAKIGFAREFKEESIYTKTDKTDKKLDLGAGDFLNTQPKNWNSNELRFSKKVLKKDIYELRYRALDNKLSDFEIGYILYYLANHRGSSAISSLDVDDSAKGENKKRLNETTKVMKEKGYRTFGEMLYKENIEGKDERQSVRNKKNKNFKYFSDRFSILNEVDLILKKQQEFYPEKLTEGRIGKIKDIIDFEGEKDVVESKKCIYSGLETLPLASSLYEERRILENLNNVRISYKYDSSWQKHPLTKEQRDILFNKLILGGDLTESETKKLLKDTFDTNDIKITLPGRKKDKKLQGSSIAKLDELDFYKNLPEESKSSFIKEYIHSPDDKSFMKYLRNTYKLSENEAKDILTSGYLSEDNIRKGYSDISKELTEEIIKNLKLETHITYNDALEQAILDDKEKPERQRLIKEKEHKVYSKLPYYGEVLEEYVQPVIARSYLPKFKDTSPVKQKFNQDELEYGQIPNPVVHKTLNQLRKVINEVIEEYGELEEIIIEYSRELQMSEEERDKLSRKQSANEKEIEDVKKLFKEKGENNPSFNQIKAYRLAKFQGFICPYTGKSIAITDIIDGKIDVDHIIPESFSHDSRNFNLVACFTEVNALKSNKTPYEAFGDNPEYWNNILNFLNSKGREKYNEFNGWRFKEEAREEFKKRNPFLQRYKTDNSYIAKASRKYLLSLFSKEDKYSVYTFKSDLVALARKCWGFNNLTFELTEHFLNTKEKEDLNKEVNATTGFKKNRIDVRHHAMDALMLLLVNRSNQQKISTLTHKYGKDYFQDFNMEKYKKMTPEDQVEAFSKRDEILGNPLLNREQMKNILLKTKISYKANHKKEGQTNKETLYKVVLDPNKDSNYIKISNKKELEIKELKLSSFDDKEKVKEAIAKQITMPHNISLEEELREENFSKVQKMIGQKGNNYEKLDELYDTAKNLLEAENQEKEKEGKRQFEITERAIWVQVLKLLFKKFPKGYQKFENQESSKLVVLKSPKVGESGFGYSSGNNHRIDLYYNEKGELKAEPIRRVDALDKKFIPNYQAKGFVKIESLYNKDIIELDYKEDDKYLNNPNTSAPKGKVWFKMTTFTQTGEDNVQIELRYYNKSGSQKDTNMRVSSLAKLGFKKIVLSPLGKVKYRSRLLTNR